MWTRTHSDGSIGDCRTNDSSLIMKKNNNNKKKTYKNNNRTQDKEGRGMDIEDRKK